MINTTHQEVSGFAAGTLIYTQNGLKPIEQIQVGDNVLSKHESGEGEREYKRVTRTVKHEDRQVIYLGIGGLQADDTDRYYDLAVTPEHSIWVQNKGWKEAGKIKATYPPTKLELLSNENPKVASNIRLFKTDQPDIAWHPLMSKADWLGSMGKRVHVPSVQVVETDVFIGIDYVRTSKRAKPEHLYTTTVYNLEVEDFHSYYVGRLGIWVGASGGNAAQTLLEKATDKAAKAKPKPAVAPFTINKMDATLKVALRGDSVLGDPDSLRERYKLVRRCGNYTSTTQFDEYSLSELFGGRSGIGILLKVERPYSRLKLTARTRLPLECFPSPASLSEEEKYLFHYRALGGYRFQRICH